MIRFAFAAALWLALPAFAYANTSHKGWPKINGDLKMHKQDQSGELRATKRFKHNELLGGHGNDVIIAGQVGDVIWGDYKPSGQPESQSDQLIGGPRKDFIYASHGYNLIRTNGGNDQVHAHFGRGEIFCGKGKPTIFLSHRGRPGWKLHNCHRISYKTGNG
jgi:Ca2+-binding RTX toxin-like protein